MTNENAFRKTALAEAAACEVRAELNAYGATILWGLTQPTDDELQTLWPEVATNKELVAKRIQRAKKARNLWAEAYAIDPEHFAPVVELYQQGANFKKVTERMTVVAALNSVFIKTAKDLLAYLQGVAGQTVIDGQIHDCRSIAQIIQENHQQKSRQKANPAPKQQTAKGKQSNGAAPEPAAAHAGAIRDSDNATGDLLAATDGLLSDVETLIRATVDQAMGAATVAEAVAIMAKAWSKAAGVADSQPLAKVA